MSSLKPITRSELNDRLWKLSRHVLLTLGVKGNDYATEEDPLKNLRGAELLGLPARTGVLIRLGDKMARLVSLDIKARLSGAGPAVKDESMADTVLDLIGYGMLLYVMLGLEQTDAASVPEPPLEPMPHEEET